MFPELADEQIEEVCEAVLESQSACVPSPA
jgi:hypothetical protein